jgi:hypothetical protein
VAVRRAAVLVGCHGVFLGLVVSAVVVKMSGLAMVMSGGFMMRSCVVVMLARRMFGCSHVRSFSYLSGFARVT